MPKKPRTELDALLADQTFAGQSIAADWLEDHGDPKAAGRLRLAVELAERICFAMQVANQRSGSVRPFCRMLSDTLDFTLFARVGKKAIFANVRAPGFGAHTRERRLDRSIIGWPDGFTALSPDPALLERWCVRLAAEAVALLPEGEP